MVTLKVTEHNKYSIRVDLLFGLQDAYRNMVIGNTPRNCEYWLQGEPGPEPTFEDDGLPSLKDPVIVHFFYTHFKIHNYEIVGSIEIGMELHVWFRRATGDAWKQLT